MTKSFQKQLETYIRPILIILGVLFVLSFLLRISFIAHGLNSLRFLLFRGGAEGTELINSRRITKDSLREERNSFREQLASLSVNSSELEALRTENNMLKDLLGYTADDRYERIPARILGMNSADYTFTIDRGSTDTISIGDIAIIGNGVIAGIVSDVKAYNATISTLQADGMRILASTTNGEAIGVLEGEGGYLIHAPFIPKDIEIETGNPILTNGNTANIPDNLVIGSVDSVTKNEQDAFQDGYLRPWYDIHELTFVDILHLP